MNPKLKNLLVGLAAIVVLLIATSVVDGTDDGGTNDPDGTELVVDATDEVGANDTDDQAEALNRSDDQATADDSTADDSTADDSDDTAPSQRFSDLPVISPAELPIEAIDTLDLIASGGPYPYSQDDSTFQNREGILPDEAGGHYREYTVDTPGESDRGARRIVAGADGALYYTDDHYDSFAEIVFGR